MVILGLKGKGIQDVKGVEISIKFKCLSLINGFKRNKNGVLTIVACGQSEKGKKWRNL